VFFESDIIVTLASMSSQRVFLCLFHELLRKLAKVDGHADVETLADSLNVLKLKAQILFGQMDYRTVLNALKLLQVLSCVLWSAIFFRDCVASALNLLEKPIFWVCLNPTFFFKLHVVLDLSHLRGPASPLLFLAFLRQVGRAHSSDDLFLFADLLGRAGALPVHYGFRSPSALSIGLQRSL
jgi:hypothetical protein